MDEVAQPQEEDGHWDHQQPQLPGELDPFGVTNRRQPEGDEQHWIGGVRQVGKSVAEAVGGDGELAGYAHQVSQWQQDGHHQYSLGTRRADEEFNQQRQQVNDEHCGEG